MGLEEASRYGEVQLLCNPGRYLSTHSDLLDAQIHLIWQVSILRWLLATNVQIKVV